MVVFYLMLAAKNHRHVFTKAARWFKKRLQFIYARFLYAKLFAHYVTPSFPVLRIHFLFY